MNLIYKRIIACIALISITEIYTLQEHRFVINKVDLPSQKAVEKQEQNILFRLCKRHVTTAATAVSLVYAYHLLANASQYLKDMKQQEHRLQLLESMSQQMPKPSLDKAKKASWSLYSGVYNTVAFLVGGIPNFMTGVLLQKGYENIKQSLSNVYAQESVYWYAQNHTRLFKTLNDLKAYTVEFDIYSELLNAEAFNQETKTHMKVFVHELSKLTKDRADSELLGQTNNDFLEMLFDSVRKKYVRKSGELEKLEGYVIPLVSKVKRAQDMGSDRADLFDQCHTRMHDITFLCNQLVKDIENLLAFVEAKYGKQEKVYAIVHTLNKYLDRMQTMVNMSPEELEVLSLQNQGMFTCSYEYDRLVIEQLDFLHRYCV